MDKYIDEIVIRIKSFVDDLLSNKVDRSIIEAHKIPEVALDVARSDSHPSQHKMQRRIFQHVMRNIGYYERLAEQKGLDELLAHIDCALKEPAGFNNIDEMIVPSFIFGVKNALCKIQTLADCDTPSCSNAQVPHDAQYTKAERGFYITYKKEWSKCNNDQINVNNSDLMIDGTHFVVPNNGSHLSKLQRNFTAPDEVEICIDRLVSPYIDSSDKYYLRYITKVPQKSEWAKRSFCPIGTTIFVKPLHL